jgi:hypothetical protein
MPANVRTKPNPKDLTGNRKRILAEQHADELAQRQGELSMRHAEQQASLDIPIELDETGREVSYAPAPVEEGPVDVPKEIVRIRIACDLPKVTIGQNNHFDFLEGQVYDVPLHVAQHLDRLGYVWQVL